MSSPRRAPALATDERILAAAGELFAEHGPGAVSMGEVARAAGCSRATLYRYFADRRELQLAYLHREARRIGALVAREVAGVEGRQARLVTAVLSALRLVRGSPLLAGWFQSESAAVTASLVQSSTVLESLGVGLVEDELAAAWVVRVIVMLLMLPGETEDEERQMLERFLAPMLDLDGDLHAGPGSGQSRHGAEGR